MKFKNIFLLLFAVPALLAACDSDRMAKRVLADASRIMAEHPDSAYSLLTGSDSLFACASEPLRMEYILYTADAGNKAYISFTTDSMLKIASAYYDVHGDANERVKAHYLLGCAYRDMGDAAGALHEYYEAVESADTLSSDCNYKLLSCVYGQMADVYGSQFMPKKAIDACCRYSKYALLAGDTLNWIVGMERCIPEYYSAGDTAKVFQITDSVSRLYRRYGFTDKASAVYIMAITAYLEQHNYDKAGELMRLFETESGLFDKDGNIEQRRELYYYDVGMYNLGIGRFDVAEKSFRRLPQYGHDYASAKGLLELYRQKDDKDSVLKYSHLLENALDEEQNNLETEKIEKVISAHNYARHKKVMSQMSAKAEWQETVLWCICVVVAVALVAVCCRKKIRKHLLKNNPPVVNEDSLPALADNGADDSEIKSDDMQAVLVSDIVAKFRKACEVSSKKNRISANDWTLLLDEIRQCMPLFYGFLFNNEELSDIERKTCVLVCLNFPPADIVILLNSTSQSITNFKRKVNRKLFNDDSARTLSRNLHELCETEN